MPEPKTSTFETNLPIEQKVEVARRDIVGDTLARATELFCGGTAPFEPNNPSQPYSKQHDYVLLVGLEATTVVGQSTAVDHPEILTEITEVATAVTHVLVTEAAIRRCAYAEALIGNDNIITADDDIARNKLQQDKLSRIFGSLEQEERRLHTLTMRNFCLFSCLGNGGYEQAVIDTAKASIPRQLRDEEEAVRACLRSQRTAESQLRNRSFGQALLGTGYHRRRRRLRPAS